MIKLLITLQPPEVSGAFVGQPYPYINGSTWSIAYEFRCYLLVIILYYVGVFKRPLFVGGLSLLLFVLYIFRPFSPSTFSEEHHLISDWLSMGQLGLSLRLIATFLVGSIFYLMRGRINYTLKSASISAAALIASLFFAVTAEAGVAIFGGYLIFATATLGGKTILGRINNKNDISYGAYLYAWPIEKLILWFHPATPPIIACICTVILASICGWLSWHGLEKPAMRMLRAVEGRMARSPQMPVGT